MINMLKEIMLAIAGNVDIVAKVITEVGTVIKDIHKSNNENHNESEKTRKELLETNREILETLKQINDKIDNLTTPTPITVETPTEVNEEMNVTTNENKEEEATVVTPAFEGTVVETPYTEEVPASKQIINQVNDVFSFFESMTTSEERKEENVNKGKTVMTVEELTAAAAASSNTSKPSVNIMNDIFQTPSEETAMKTTSRRQVVNEYIPQTPTPVSSETDDIIERLQRRPLPDSLKNIQIGNSSSFSSFDNKPEPPVVQQPVQQPRQYSPIITPPVSNIYTPTNPQNRTFSLRFDRNTKNITVVCHDDNSTLEYKYMSEGYKMIVTKLKTENRMLSTLTDNEILEFLRTTIGREMQYGYSTRENGGIPFTGNNNVQNTYPTPAPGYGYDMMNASTIPTTPPQPSTFDQAFAQPVQPMNLNLGGYGYNIYQPQASDEIRPMFQQTHNLRLFS